MGGRRIRPRIQKVSISLKHCRYPLAIALSLAIVLAMFGNPIPAIADNEGSADAVEGSSEEAEPEGENAEEGSSSSADGDSGSQSSKSTSGDGGGGSDDSTQSTEESASSWRYSEGEVTDHPSTGSESIFSILSSSYSTWKEAYGTFCYGVVSGGTTTEVEVDGVERVGIDVSKWQGTIDWEEVADAGIDFAIIRCGYGNDDGSGDDGYFVANVEGAKAAGIDIGVYLYSYATSTSDAESEADHALRMLEEAGLDPDDLDLPVFLDMEDSTQESLGSSELGDIAETFCAIVGGEGYETGIYANKSWWENRLTDGFFDTVDCKWVARYSSSTSVTSSTVDGTDIWQFTSSGSVPGIEGDVDVNFDYNGEDGYSGDGISRSDIDELALQYADAVEDGTYAVLNGKDGRGVLDVEGASDEAGTNVQLYGYNGTDAQLWEVAHDDDGYVTFTNVGSGKVLDVESGSTESGTNVQQWDSNGTYSQKWIVVPDDDGSGYSIRSAVLSDLVLDLESGGTSDGTNVQVADPGDAASQSFQLVSVDDVDVDPGVQLDGLTEGTWFTISPVYAADSAIGVASYEGGEGGSDGSGDADDGGDGPGDADDADAPDDSVRLYDSDLTYSQLFEFEFVESGDGGKGYYRIVNVESGMAIAVENGEVVKGADVVQREVDGDDDSQLWSVDVDDDGVLSFVNKASGLSMDVCDGSSENGTNVQGYTASDVDAQGFTVSAQADLLTEGTYIVSSSEDGSYSMEVADGSVSDGANVQLGESGSSLSQRWLVRKVEGRVNSYTVESLLSGKLLTDEDGDLVVRDADGGEDQIWVPVESDGGLTFTSMSSGDAIDIAGDEVESGTDVQTYESNGTSAQSFELEATTTSVPEGTYRICLASDTSLVLGVEDGSLSNSANIEVQSLDEGDGCQEWEVSKNDDGTYLVVNARTGRVLDVQGGWLVSGSNVRQLTFDGSDAQKWRISYADGGFRVATELDVSSTLGTEGDEVSAGDDVRVSAEGLAQRFVFVPVSE